MISQVKDTFFRYSQTQLTNFVAQEAGNHKSREDADGILGATSNPESPGVHGNKLRRVILLGVLCGSDHQGPGVEEQPHLCRDQE